MMAYAKNFAQTHCFARLRAGFLLCAPSRGLFALRAFARTLCFARLRADSLFCAPSRAGRPLYFLNSRVPRNCEGRIPYPDGWKKTQEKNSCVKNQKIHRRMNRTIRRNRRWKTCARSSTTTPHTSKRRAYSRKGGGAPATPRPARAIMIVAVMSMMAILRRAAPDGGGTASSPIAPIRNQISKRVKRPMKSARPACARSLRACNAARNSTCRKSSCKCRAKSKKSHGAGGNSPAITRNAGIDRRNDFPCTCERLWRRDSYRAFISCGLEAAGR